MRNNNTLLEDLAVENNPLGFREKIRARLNELREDMLSERKKNLAAIYYVSEKIDDQEEDLETEQLEVLKQGADENDEKNDANDDLKKKFDEENLDESARSVRRKRNVQKVGRLKVVKIRIRQGKVQRRKKISAVKGFTLRKGKLKRMTPAERRKRKMGARRAKFKRKGKLSRIRTKLKRSLRRRKSMGL